MVLTLELGPPVACLSLTGLVCGRSGYADLLARLGTRRVDARLYAVALLTAPIVASAVLLALALTGVQPASATWFAAMLGIIGVVAMIYGAVAWIGALINTAQLADKTWFLVLLLLGIFGLGFIPMLVYVLAGSDGTVAEVPKQPPAPDLLQAA